MAIDHSPKFLAFLAEFLDSAEAEHLATRLSRLSCSPGLLTLLFELRDRSPKSVRAALATLPGLLDVLADHEMVKWLDLAVALSERSGATALKYCQETMELVRGLSPESRGHAFDTALGLAEQDAPMALEALRHMGAVAVAAGGDALGRWAQIGADLAKWDYVLGVEYFRRSPDALQVFSLKDLKPWATVSMRLVTPNSLGKPDYMPALTYFRTSPLLLGEVASPAVRRTMMRLANVLAERDPARTITCLGEVPGWLRDIRSAEWQERVLQYAILIAERDPEAAIAYLRRAPQVIDLIGAEDTTGQPTSIERFEEWFKGGMGVLEYNPEAARAYFSAESRKALEAMQQAASGVALREVGRVLKLFASGLSGKPLSIQPQDPARLRASSFKNASGEYVIRLPARLRRYPSREQNFRFYRVITAHEAGHLEYGTYDLDMRRLEDLAGQACLRYGGSPPALRSLEDLFYCYPHPALIRDLWLLAEDARIEARLKTDYPGLRRDLDLMVREEIAQRSLTHGMSVKEMVVELLLQLSGGAPDEVRVPFALEEVVGRCWALLQAIAQPYASAESVVRVIHRVYVLIEEMTAANEPHASDEILDSEAAQNPRAGEPQGTEYHPAANFEFRGEPQPERVGVLDKETEMVPLSTQSVEGDLSSPREVQEKPQRLTQHQLRDAVVPSTELTQARPSSNEPVLDGTTEGLTGLRSPTDHHTFLYDEWDSTIQDYRGDWCRVIERISPEGSEGFVEQTRNTYGGVIRLLRRYFEGIRPPAFGRVRRQADGDEIDLEAAIEAVVACQTQVSPMDDVYIRRDRRERDVAAAFLVDLSGSTGRHIADGIRVIDIEKEGLVLLAEALEALGDQYALYGYSGQSRRDVQFVIVKDFEERYGPGVWRRLGTLEPLNQNRDGAAIRHAVRRLSARSSRVKLLVLLSDGRPLDDLYDEEYALEDTKAALREARAQGVHIFCVTVDREGSDYLARMYGDVAYLVIDRVQALPERLPRIYRMLTS